MALETVALSAKAGTRSIKATIPEGIVEFLDIQPGDRLEWSMDDLDGERVARVRKLRE